MTTSYRGPRFGSAGGPEAGLTGGLSFKRFKILEKFGGMK